LFTSSSVVDRSECVAALDNFDCASANVAKKAQIINNKYIDTTIIFAINNN